MHRYEFQHGGFIVIPIAVRFPDSARFMGVAELKKVGPSGPVLVTLTCRDKEFDTAEEARQYAEQQARANIDAKRE